VAVRRLDQRDVVDLGAAEARRRVMQAAPPSDDHDAMVLDAHRCSALFLLGRPISARMANRGLADDRGQAGESTPRADASAAPRPAQWVGLQAVEGHARFAEGRHELAVLDLRHDAATLWRILAVRGGPVDSGHQVNAGKVGVLAYQSPQSADCAKGLRAPFDK
jgi:hypothetical protein